MSAGHVKYYADSGAARSSTRVWDAPLFYVKQQSYCYLPIIFVAPTVSEGLAALVDARSPLLAPADGAVWEPQGQLQPLSG